MPLVLIQSAQQNCGTQVQAAEEAVAGESTNQGRNLHERKRRLDAAGQ